VAMVATLLSVQSRSLSHVGRAGMPYGVAPCRWLVWGNSVAAWFGGLLIRVLESAGLTIAPRRKRLEPGVFDRCLHYPADS